MTKFYVLKKAGFSETEINDVIATWYFINEEFDSKDGKINNSIAILLLLRQNN